MYHAQPALARERHLACASPDAYPQAFANIWWAHQDLNLEPTDYESAALTN